MTELVLPFPDRSLRRYRLAPPRPFPARSGAPFTRVAIAAAHVVADPLAPHDPWLEPAIDWDATIAYRRHLWDLGLGVAEAMDTAQRGGGLGWPEARELIGRTLDAARDVPGAEVVCGIGTDQLDESRAHTLAAITDAYLEQAAAVEERGGRLVVMASRALARAARTPDDYAAVYDRVLAAARRPVVLHWLGAMFDPALAGYWGGGTFERDVEVCLAVIGAHRDKVDGIKLSLLDAGKEVALRARLPAGVKMYTGDDFNYPELMAGADGRHSHALLGIFDAIAPAASGALAALAAGDEAQFRAILDPTVPLARHVFGAPTRFYKTGVVFLAYLNGHQRHFTMIGGQESARSVLHLAELFRLADAAGLLRDPDLAAHRMRAVLAVAGVES
jgi:hypothetical protein